MIFLNEEIKTFAELGFLSRIKLIWRQFLEDTFLHPNNKIKKYFVLQNIQASK